MLLVVKNIGILLQARLNPVEKVSGKAMSQLPVINDAWLFCKNGVFEAFGSMKEFDTEMQKLDPEGKAEHVNAQGGIVCPTWCDSHTHIVYAGSREKEFVDRIHGLTYEEIAKRGGGILNSAARLATATEDELFEQAMFRVDEMIHFGTGAIEIKSGYGLSTDSEIKMLRVIKRIKENVKVAVKATFLGAHALPAVYKNNRGEYIRLICDEMLPRIHDEGLADFCDVFCDRGFFTPDETSRILETASEYGLRPKIHANELDFSGGIETGVSHQALSVDHLEFTGDEQIHILLNSQTMPTLLPSTAFFLKLKYAPARKMIDAGLPVALATDYNPGSSPSGNMPYVLSLACIYMNMDPQEALNAATVNSAYAMALSETHGSVTPGRPASFFITRPLPSVAFIPYSFGSNPVRHVYLNGVRY
jgi:imidazolonepropionase